MLIYLGCWKTLYAEEHHLLIFEQQLICEESGEEELLKIRRRMIYNEYQFRGGE